MQDGLSISGNTWNFVIGVHLELKKKNDGIKTIQLDKVASVTDNYFLIKVRLKNADFDSL